MRKIRVALMFATWIGLTSCSYKEIEYPGAIPGGYYNAYINKNAVILYKRPSSKFGCWQSSCGWDCVRH